MVSVLVKVTVPINCHFRAVKGATLFHFRALFRSHLYFVSSPRIMVTSLFVLANKGDLGEKGRYVSEKTK
jgi:hypothetical protein